MGEIKIKSENLFDVNGEHTSVVWDNKDCLIISDNAVIVNVVRPGYMTGIYYDKVYKPGTYTFAMKQLAAQSGKTAISVVSSAPFAGGVYNNSYKAYTATFIKHNDIYYITIEIIDSTKIGFFVNGYFSVNDKIYDIQLLEGTYTSETIPEYQPYFLNKPAHQYVNGEWIDIPTHKYTNNRWQGELTSQSPLKFRADGEMLDWRIEGASGGVGDWDETAQRYKIPVRVEGENLFDINGNYSAYVYQGSPVCRVDNGQIIVNAIAPYYFTYINFSALVSSGQYTIKCKASANFRAMRLLLTKPFNTGTWNDSYQRYYVDMIKNDDYYAYTFTVDEDFAIGFAISGTTGDTGTIDEIMLNKGSTAFPYGGTTTNIYTDHQLMDGDSIDYATDQTAIPIATGNNTLTVDTAVQPKSVFVKFEG